MTLTFELDLDRVKLNQDIKYVGQRSLTSKSIVRTHRQTHIYTDIGSLKLSATSD